MRAEGCCVAVLGRFSVVGDGETAADEEDVAGEDVAALGLGADIEALGFSAGGEGGERDAVCFVGVVGDGVLGRVGVVVEEDAAAGDAAVGGPVVDAVAEIGVWAQDVGAVDVVVECAG